MFRIGEMYLVGQKTKILGITVKSGASEAAAIFGVIIRNAPYGKYTARAQFDLGRAREKQNNNESAIAAYQAVVEKFPNDPLAVDAQYQIGYIWSKASNAGTYDPAAAAHARVAFEDFLARFPNSEKSKQAKQNLNQMEHKQTGTAYDIAKYYDKQKLYRAAAIYYNEVIRQQPGSTEGERAKKRISQLRAKVGDAQLQPPAVSAAAANKKSKKPQTSGETGAAPSSNEMAPLPPTDTDASLPPPASLLPDTTTAPPSTSESTPEPAATPQTSPTPETAAKP
jgi:outer membrane protein assembly factor BamD